MTVSRCSMRDTQGQGELYLLQGQTCHAWVRCEQGVHDLALLLQDASLSGQHLPQIRWLACDSSSWKDLHLRLNESCSLQDWLSRACQTVRMKIRGSSAQHTQVSQELMLCDRRVALEKFRGNCRPFRAYAEDGRHSCQAIEKRCSIPVMKPRLPSARTPSGSVMLAAGCRLCSCSELYCCHYG